MASLLQNLPSTTAGSIQVFFPPSPESQWYLLPEAPNLNHIMNCWAPETSQPDATGRQKLSKMHALSLAHSLAKGRTQIQLTDEEREAQRGNVIFPRTHS